MDRFIKLTTKLTNPNITETEKLREICMTTSSLIQGADRVSLWRFVDDFHAIESMICYDKSTHHFSAQQRLYRKDFNDYFTGILENEVINAPKARTHALTQCFNESYFKPLNIQSLLDFILHEDFCPTGVICCETVGRETPWSHDDIETLRRIARASSMYFKVG